MGDSKEQEAKNEECCENVLAEEGKKEAPQQEDFPSMPAPTFSTFILSLASSAFVHMGEIPNPETGKQEQSLPLAKHTIDMLSMLEDKINNGLTSDEKKLFQEVLYELRMKFIVKTK